MIQDKQPFVLASKGERVFLHGLLSRDVAFRLMVTDALGPVEIGKLIRILELQKELLSEDGDSD